MRKYTDLTFELPQLLWPSAISSEALWCHKFHVLYKGPLMMPTTRAPSSRRYIPWQTQIPKLRNLGKLCAMPCSTQCRTGRLPRRLGSVPEACYKFGTRDELHYYSAREGLCMFTRSY